MYRDHSPPVSAGLRRHSYAAVGELDKALGSLERAFGRIDGFGDLVGRIELR